ncbi:MAG: hydroxymethylglutaryl-CoA synthase [Flavobacteriales bacterium]|nr:hydroxymethylglutaryl-CoA synthase [Flavobacteriales bacterium]
MKKIGIDAISFYVPSLYVDLEKLAKKRNIAFAKLNKGLGLNKMAFPDVNEDAASFAANALLELIFANKIDPSTIGRIYLGTESALDAAKPTSTYALEAVENQLSNTFGPRCFKNCDVLDMTFACVGAVDALHNSIDWVTNGKGRKAVVIASDFAKYELKSGGEYTQGAGAVAMLVTENPSIISISNTWGIATKSEGDFFKPRRIFNKLKVLKETAKLLKVEISDTQAENIIKNNPSEFWSNSNINFELFKEEPVFDGPYSNACYQDRIHEALEHFKGQKNVNVLKDWKHLLFHLPYAFQGRRMIVKNWVNWLQENNQIHNLTNEIGSVNFDNPSEWYKLASKSKLYNSFIDQKVAPGEKASSEIGNMYTASIFMSLLSFLNFSFENKNDIEEDMIGFFSYGSGSKSKVFEGRIESKWKEKIKKSNLFSLLEHRKEISFETYVKLHKNQLNNSVNKTNAIQLQNIEKSPSNIGLRQYAKLDV